MTKGVIHINKSKEECLEMLKEDLIHPSWSNYSLTGMFGKLNKDSFELWHHTAYVRNSFKRVLTGKIFENNKGCKIKYKITVVLLTRKSILIWTFAATPFAIFITYMNGVNGVLDLIKGSLFLIAFVVGTTIIFGLIAIVIYRLLNFKDEKLVNYLRELMINDKR